ncbi:MAG: hypothetical protein F4Y44_10600 [Chloroflexi bacterium]|nr:hypothetical protein [Chloroflexota bacterium]
MCKACVPLGNMKLLLSQALHRNLSHARRVARKIAISVVVAQTGVGLTRWVWSGDDGLSLGALAAAWSFSV